MKLAPPIRNPLEDKGLRMGGWEPEMMPRVMLYTAQESNGPHKMHLTVVSPASQFVRRSMSF